MSKITPSMAKNSIRRSLLALVDPHPSDAEKDAIWKHFRSECAYCGKSISRASRTGHIDHLDPAGGNGMYNRVLACASCNGDEKRDKDWKEFLASKVSDRKAAAVRRSRITDWMAKNKPNSPLAANKKARVEALVVEVTATFDSAVQELRLLTKLPSK